MGWIFQRIGIDKKRLWDGFKENKGRIKREYGINFYRIRDRYKETMGWI